MAGSGRRSSSVSNTPVAEGPPRSATDETIATVIAAGQQFALAGPIQQVESHGCGHIHNTYRVCVDGSHITYVMQRINTTVFPDTQVLLENVARVTEHLSSKLPSNGHRPAKRTPLELIPTHTGEASYQDSAGSIWRTYICVENAYTVESGATPAQAFEAARAFGQFQADLADLPSPRLHETIPHFHHTPQRLQALESAVELDRVGRVDDVQPELAFVRSREHLADRLIEMTSAGQLTERITHNDTKINNVLFDREGHHARCIVDLDTVMPGLVHYDFGDLVRTAAATATEDESDLSRVGVDTELCEALARGYLAAAGNFLEPVEIGQLAFSAFFMTFEVGARFLTDHLDGDRYFKVHRPGHNLDRARAQFRLAEVLEKQLDQFDEVILRAWRERSR